MVSVIFDDVLMSSCRACVMLVHCVAECGARYVFSCGRSVRLSGLLLHKLWKRKEPVIGFIRGRVLIRLDGQNRSKVHCLPCANVRCLIKPV